MRALSLVVVLIASAFASALVSAHGGPPPSYDPLQINIDGFPTTDGKISDAAPANGQVCFKQVDPSAAATPLTFSRPSPVTFSPSGGFHVIISITYTAPVAAQDQNGKSLLVATLVNGTPVGGMSLQWSSSGPVETPGSFDRIDTVLVPATNVTIPQGAVITLALTPMMPALPDGAMCVVVGEASSTTDFQFAQVPTVYDLALNDRSLQQWDMVTQNASYPDPNLAINDIEVFHDHIQTNYVTFLTDKAYINMKGAELSTDAEVYHAFPDSERRLNATHDFLVAGTFVRVHPGVGVVVPIDLSKVPAGQNYLACIRNCPQTLNMTLLPYHSLQAPGKPGTDLRVVEATPTVPTSGTSVQKQDATEKKAPGTQVLGVVLAASLVALVLSRRR